MDRVFTAIERAALPKQVVYTDFGADSRRFPKAKSVSAAADKPSPTGAFGP